MLKRLHAIGFDLQRIQPPAPSIKRHPARGAQSRSIFKQGIADTGPPRQNSFIARLEPIILM